MGVQSSIICYILSMFQISMQVHYVHRSSVTVENRQITGNRQLIYIWINHPEEKWKIKKIKCGYLVNKRLLKNFKSFLQKKTPWRLPIYSKSLGFYQSRAKLASQILLEFQLYKPFTDIAIAILYEILIYLRMCHITKHTGLRTDFAKLVSDQSKHSQLILITKTTKQSSKQLQTIII